MSRNLTRLVGVRLLPDEHDEGMARAELEGVTLPALMRRLLVGHLARSPETAGG